MSLFSKIIIITVTCTLLFSSISFAGWNIVDHPFETVTIENGDKVLELDNNFLFWTRVTINDNEKNYRLSRIWVNCSTLNYHELFRETSTDNKDMSNNIKVAKPEDMLYYSIMYHCDNNPEGWGMCYPDDEDLDRTPEEEMLDILTKEMEL